jgi:hypothetical protein
MRSTGGQPGRIHLNAWPFPREGRCLDWRACPYAQSGAPLTYVSLPPTAQAVLSHMREEARQLRERQRQLAVELEVVCAQVAGQEGKLRLTVGDERAADERCGLVAATLRPLQEEQEKLRALVHALGSQREPASLQRFHR